MANHYFKEKGVYQLKTFNEHLKVDVRVGDGQPGSYSFLLNSRLVSSNQEADLGKSEGLVEAKLIISVMVTDEREETNWTSIEVVFREGSHEKVFGPYRKEVPQAGDNVFYTIEFKFSAP